MEGARPGLKVRRDPRERKVLRARPGLMEPPESKGFRALQESPDCKARRDLRAAEEEPQVLKARRDLLEPPGRKVLLVPMV